MGNRAGQARSSRLVVADSRWASPKGIRWGRSVGWFAVWVIVVAGSAAFVSLPDFEPNAPAAKPSPGDNLGNRIEAVAFSVDGSTLLSCGADGIMEFWPMADVIEGRSALPEIIAEGQPRLAAAYSPDGRYFAAAGIDSASIWSIDGGVLRAFRRLHGQTYRCLAFAPDGARLALGGDDGVIRIFDVETGLLSLRLAGHEDVVRSLAFSPDGRRLVSSGQDRRVMLWDLETGRAIKNLTNSGAYPVQYVAFSPDGQTVAVGESAGTPRDVLLLDSETGRVRARLKGHETGIRTLAFAPDGHTLATAGFDRKVILWDLATNRVRQSLGEHVGLVESLAFSPDGARLAFGGEDHALSIWELKSPRLLSINCLTHARSLYHLTLTQPRGRTGLPGA